jgi:glycosyltransferase involved in cell wall biosynthesis
MKIAHIVDCMEVGGAETLVSQLCSWQRDQGHEPRVYSILGLGPLGEKMLDDGFVVQANLGKPFIGSLRRFFRIFREWRPDVVHLHNPTPTSRAAIPARVLGVPSVISTRHGLVAPPRRFVVELRYGIAAICCDWIVGVCDATTENLKTLPLLPAPKVVRIYNGTLPLQRATARDCPPKSGFTVLCVARLAPVKNHSLLLHAFRLALSALPTLRLWKVGDGNQRAALQAQASDLNIAAAVTFWGQQLDVAQFFSAADAFIMASNSEGLPLSLLQALSLGLPAIVTDVGGMAEVVRLAQAGSIVAANDPGKMAEAIVRMAQSEADRNRFSAAGRASFHAQFTAEIMARNYMSLYRKARTVAQSSSSA